MVQEVLVHIKLDEKTKEPIVELRYQGKLKTFRSNFSINRPMSSMTEEEKEEYCNFQDIFLCSSQYPITDAYELFH